MPQLRGSWITQHWAVQKPSEFASTGSDVCRSGIDALIYQDTRSGSLGARWWWQLVLPHRIDAWSLPSLQQRFVKSGAPFVKHARYYWLLLAESHLTRRLFGAMLQRIWALPVPTG